VACEATTPNTTIDFLTFNASELRTGRKQSTQVNIQCTGGGGTVNVSSNEYDNTGKKVIRNDGGDDLYAIITASLNGGEKPITPTGQPLTLLEGGNPLTIWADIRANEPQKHEGFFTSTSVITLTYQ
jgi:type 1 fimbria pilin